jgi:hypothetical protein
VIAAPAAIDLVNRGRLPAVRIEGGGDDLSRLEPDVILVPGQGAWRALLATR